MWQLYQFPLCPFSRKLRLLMSEKGIRHVPVTDGRMVLGVVSIRDVVREVVADREITIKGLENYIVGGELRT